MHTCQNPSNSDAQQCLVVTAVCELDFQQWCIAQEQFLHVNSLEERQAHSYTRLLVVTANCIGKSQHWLTNCCHVLADKPIPVYMLMQLHSVLLHLHPQQYSGLLHRTSPLQKQEMMLVIAEQGNQVKFALLLCEPTS